MDRRNRFTAMLVKAAEEQGCTTRAAKGGKMTVQTPKGVISLHGSPSDRRHWKNLKAQWLRHGLTWPWGDRDMPN